MLVVTGYHGSGKTEIANLCLAKNFGHIDLGPELRKIHKQKNPDMNFADWCRDGESRYGKDFTDIMLIENIKKTLEEYVSAERKPQDIIITGSRSLKGINFIRNNLQPFNGKALKIVHICAPQKILKDRYCKREGKDITEYQFKEILSKDKLLGIDTILGYEDYVITNCGTLNDLKKVSKKLLKEIGYDYDSSDENYLQKKIKSCKDKNEKIDAILKVNDKSKDIVAKHARNAGYEALVFDEIPFISIKIEAYEIEDFLNFSSGEKRRYFKQKYHDNDIFIESVEFPSELILRRVHKSPDSHFIKV